MRIHHVSIPAHDTERVARVLAELLGARVIAMPHPKGSLLVHAGDDDGSAIEVWPAATRGNPGADELDQRDLPLPEAWPHHAYVTTAASDADRIYDTFVREGWKAQKVYNGPPGRGFGLVRGWIENHTAIEIGGSEMRAEYERFFRDALRRG